MLQKSKATNLIFDMHNELRLGRSFEAAKAASKRSNNCSPQKWPSFTLDEENSGTARQVRILLSASVLMKLTGRYFFAAPDLNLTEQAVEAVFNFKRHLGEAGCRKRWICPIRMN